MDISLVVPTYNRGEILKDFLLAVEDQTYPARKVEVVIVDDGSTDQTKDVVRERIRNGKVKIIFILQEHKGPAVARNLGVKKAKGEIILFLGDDILPTQKLLSEHVSWHKKFSQENIAVLGYVTWSPKLEITPLMKWLEESGTQFAYRDLQGKKETDYTHLYASNVSFKNNFLLKNGLFDQDFPFAAYEDLELGYRLKRKGLKILYNRNAIAYHYHPTNVKDLEGRMVRVGQSARILFQKHPELKGIVASQGLSLSQKIREFIDPPLYLLTRLLRLKMFADRYFATKALGKYVEGFKMES